MTNITLYTKSRCHLCDEMKSHILKLSNEIKFTYQEVDIENNKELYEKYKDKIPVLFVNEIIFAKFKTDEEKLRRKLLRS